MAKNNSWFKLTSKEDLTKVIEMKEVRQVSQLDYDLDATGNSTIKTAHIGRVPHCERPGPAWTSPETRLVLACCAIPLSITILPMIILALVYHYQTQAMTCPLPDLCPELKQISHNYYYVNYSASHLVAIASWTSAISLSLISVFTFSILGQIRPLSTSPVVYKSIRMLLVGIAAAIFVQAANTWLHISTETVETTDTQISVALNHLYSRGVGPWCASEPTLQNACNKNFWGCGMGCWQGPSGTELVRSNESESHAILTGKSWDHTILNFTDKDSVTYSILGPAVSPDTVDWTAASFAVSSQCKPVMPGGCDIRPTTNAKNVTGALQFSCTEANSGADIAGNITHNLTQLHYVDAHKYFNDSAPFSFYEEDLNPPGLKDAAKNIAPHLTEDDEVFNNPWHWQAVLPLFDHNEPLFNSGDERIWNASLIGSPFMVLDCSSTVWDVTYAMMESHVHSISSLKSNSSVAGIASMPSFPSFQLIDDGALEGTYDANEIHSDSTVDDMIHTFSFGMSKSFLSHIGGQSDARPAIQVQTRDEKMVTRMPKAALWTFVASNLVYAILGIILGISAMRARSYGT